MPLYFNSLLRDADILPRNVRLLRHQDTREGTKKTPYELWRYERENFECYQSTQSFKNEQKLNARYWAAFVGMPDGSTMFAGLYEVALLGPSKVDIPMPHRDEIDKAGGCNVYQQSRLPAFDDLSERLFIEWGEGKKSWIQRADNQNKPILEFRKAFQEPVFPGYLRFIEQLSNLNSLPASWIEWFKKCRGIYLLTCPKTKEQYVGKADGADGVWGRWQCYLKTGHGENVALKSRDPSDYQVSILEVAGSSATENDILKMECEWKAKLQSRDMGLNRN